jgi:hypothetical protein
MKVSIDGAVHNRCNLCTRDILDGENYCEKCERSCLDDASELLDKLVMTYDTELAYECMERILEGRR